jgi:hypothetical protein
MTDFDAIAQGMTQAVPFAGTPWQCGAAGVEAAQPCRSARAAGLRGES